MDRLEPDDAGDGVRADENAFAQYDAPVHAADKVEAVADGLAAAADMAVGLAEGAACTASFSAMSVVLAPG